MKRQLKLLILLTLLIISNFLGCGDTPESVILDQILREVSSFESPYTGGLQRVGTVKNFGFNLDDPVAIEWNGETLYMLASHGRNRNKAQYLFTLNRSTGIATIISWKASNLGGSFSNGRGFTQVLHVSPNDMTWHPDGQMLAVCPVLDSIVTIDLETGVAGRITFKDDFCLRHPEGDTDFHREFSGYPVIGAGIALAWTDQGLYMWGISRRSRELVDRGYRSFGGFYKISENLKCATPISSPVFFGQPTKGPKYPDEGEANTYSLCFDTEHLYMSGAHTHALYIINQQTGSTHLIGNWYYTSMPENFKTHESGGILNTETNSLGYIQITGLAYDGTDMFAIDSLTDALYKLERK